MMASSTDEEEKDEDEDEEAEYQNILLFVGTQLRLPVWKESRYTLLV